MSALAARRAAAAARLANVTDSAPTATERLPVKVAPARPTSPTPSVPSSLDMSDLESEAGPSKRRRKPARYFAPDDDEGLQQATRPSNKRARRFSPSAPASDVEDGDDSSDAGDSSAEQDVDEGRADWTVPSTPYINGATTPKRSAATPASRFKAVTGVNYQPLAAKVLDECGIDGAGDGVVVSLGKQDVRHCRQRGLAGGVISADGS